MTGKEQRWFSFLRWMFTLRCSPHSTCGDITFMPSEVGYNICTRWDEASFDIVHSYRVNWASPHVRMKGNSAWNTSCLYPNPLDHMMRIVTTVVTGKRRRCLKWLVGNAIEVATWKSTQNLLKKCLSATSLSNTFFSLFDLIYTSIYIYKYCVIYLA